MKYLIMHGSFGSPDSNWFSWLKKELKDLGHEVILEQFPVDSWEKLEVLGKDKRDEYEVIQSVALWEKFFLQKIMPKIKGEKFSFIGHSLAPIFFLHMLEKYSLKVDQAIFVSPFLELKDRDDIWQFYPVNKDFYKKDFDFNLIKSKINKSFVVYGDNDPYVPAENPKEFSEKLNAKIIVIPNGGHCGGNFIEFPKILNLLFEETHA